MAAVKEFSIQERLETICRLQKIDSSIDNINKLRGELPIEVKDLEDEIHGINTLLGKIDTEINSIQDLIKEKQAFLKEGVEMLKKYEKQQNNVKNSREFEAINKQMEQQDLDNKEAEKQIRVSTYDIEDKKTQKEPALARLEEKNQILAIKKSELDKIQEETAKEEKELLKARKTAEESVFPRLLESYEKIRANFRNGLAVVPVERDSCGGCYSVVPPQRQSEIRLRKKMIVCEHCGRILVDNELAEVVHQ
ncbi:MAG: hypothetical protein KA275_03935 [Chitinophagaceae bacterium]|nr:hypothetical protein [Chitinophagaceae bacterium]